MKTWVRHTALGLTLGLALVACGDRHEVWDEFPGAVKAHAMVSDVAVIDDGAHRAVVLTPTTETYLDRSSISIGKNVTATAVSPDGRRVFVLAAGELPRISDDDERPSLTVIERDGPLLNARRYEMESPLGAIEVDPQGRYVAIYASSEATGRSGASFVQNPNELVIVDLDDRDPTAKPITRTLRSFGGSPQRITFSQELALPTGVRRLLVVEQEHDLSILDLDNIRDGRSDITVRLTSGATVSSVSPSGIAIDDGDPTRNDDARIAVRLKNDTNVVTLTLGPKTGDDPLATNDFSPRINLTDVGGEATSIAFVRTDAGLRLAALVPTLASAKLVDPETSVVTDVKLGAPFKDMALVTGQVPSAAPGTDVALLFGVQSGSTTSGIGFWSLGKASGTPYRSVELLNLPARVNTVYDVPEPHPELKLLETTSNTFFVLNLGQRTVSPLQTGTAASLRVARDGRRVWAFANNSNGLASIELENLHPRPVVSERGIDDVFDVLRADGGRSLLAIHYDGTVGVTVFDAAEPDSAKARAYSGLLLEGF